MQRRLALTLAGSAAIVVAASSAAMAANLGLLGSTGPGSDSVGNLDAANVADLAPAPTTATSVAGQPDPVVVYVDEYVDAPADAPDPTTTEAARPPTTLRARGPEAEPGDDSPRPSTTATTRPPSTPAPAPAPTTPSTTRVRGDDGHHGSDDHPGEHGSDD